jgi:DNA-binding LytR/AlgR family response regulator
MKLKCLAIDDEPMALEVVKDYIKKIPFLELVNSYRDSLKAIDYLQQNDVDVIFLDINMPDLTGIQFLKSLVSKPMIIFTTAYSKYAVESYNYNAVDYLLKPIEFERFVKAANKALQLYQQKNSTAHNTDQSVQENYSILIKSGTEIFNVKTNEIQYIESAGNYVTLYLIDRKIMSLYSITKLLNELPSNDFFRVHKSFVVNLNYVTKIERHQVTIGENKIPIGKIYRETFINAIKK